MTDARRVEPPITDVLDGDAVPARRLAHVVARQSHPRAQALHVWRGECRIDDGAARPTWDRCAAEPYRFVIDPVDFEKVIVLAVDDDDVVNERVGGHGADRDLLRSAVARGFAISALLLNPAAASAQNGSVRGTVVDAQGCVAPGVNVKLLHDGEQAGETSTNVQGELAFESLAEGRCQIEVTVPGFEVRRTDPTFAGAPVLWVVLHIVPMQEDVVNAGKGIKAPSLFQSRDSGAANHACACPISTTISPT